jgi:hypothetical protein
MIKNNIRATGRVKKGQKLPWDTIKALRRFSSAIGPRMTPMTRGAMG